jgi:hypothetical protein
MTPKQKAKELTDDIKAIFSRNGIGNISENTKKAAIMVVDERMEQIEEYGTIDKIYFWKQVKEEIENI